jgi:hypothetical protein
MSKSNTEHKTTAEGVFDSVGSHTVSYAKFLGLRECGAALLFRRQSFVDRSLRGFNASSVVLRLAGPGVTPFPTWYRDLGPCAVCHDIPSITPPPYLPCRRRA